MKTHDSESRGQEEAGHSYSMRRMSELFTGSTALKLVNVLCNRGGGSNFTLVRQKLVLEHASQENPCLEILAKIEVVPVCNYILLNNTAT